MLSFAVFHITIICFNFIIMHHALYFSCFIFANSIWNANEYFQQYLCDCIYFYDFYTLRVLCWMVLSIIVIKAILYMDGGVFTKFMYYQRIQSYLNCNHNFISDVYAALLYIHCVQPEL